MTEIGLSLKKFAPLQAKSWKHVPTDNKRIIYDRLSISTRGFIVGQKGDRPTDYKKLLYLPTVERQQQMLIEFCETQDDWNYLCALFESSAFQIDQLQRKDRITVFNETHYSSSKRWIGERAKTAYDDMVRLCDEYIQIQENTGNDIDVVQVANTVCDQVLGTRSGYIRGLGSGSKPVRSTSSDATSSKSTNAALREKLESTEQRLEGTTEELANT